MTPHSVESIAKNFPGSSWPTFRSFTQDKNTFILSLYIGSGIEWFKGHFLGQPVLAGVVQTHWAIAISKSLFDIKSPFHQINNLKFHTVVQPNESLDLSLAFNLEQKIIKFNYHNQHHQFSEGKVSFGGYR